MAFSSVTINSPDEVESGTLVECQIGVYNADSHAHLFLINAWAPEVGANFQIITDERWWARPGYSKAWTRKFVMPSANAEIYVEVKEGKSGRWNFDREFSKVIEAIAPPPLPIPSPEFTGFDITEYNLV